MKTINEYKNRFYNLMESTLGDVKPLITESGCGSGDIDPEVGTNIKIIYNRQGDNLEINGEEYSCYDLSKEENKFDVKDFSNGESPLEEGSYEAWGTPAGAALVKNGVFTGYGIEQTNYSDPYTELNGSDSRCGTTIGITDITISDEGVWSVGTTANDTREGGSTIYYKF